MKMIKAVTLKMLAVIIILIVIFVQLALAENPTLIKAEYCAWEHEELACVTVEKDGRIYLFFVKETPQGLLIKSVFWVTGETMILIYRVWEI